MRSPSGPSAGATPGAGRHQRDRCTSPGRPAATRSGMSARASARTTARLVMPPPKTSAGGASGGGAEGKPAAAVYGGRACERRLGWRARLRTLAAQLARAALLHGFAPVRHVILGAGETAVADEPRHRTNLRTPALGVRRCAGGVSLLSARRIVFLESPDALASSLIDLPATKCSRRSSAHGTTSTMSWDRSPGPGAAKDRLA